MLAYIGRRIVIALATMWGITLIVFVIIELPPGDAITTAMSLQAGGESGTSFIMTDEEMNNLRKLYALDRPLLVRYVNWLQRLAVGRWGVSYTYGGYASPTPVWEVVSGKFMMTIAVTGAATVLTWALFVPIGIYSAVRQYSLGDYAASFIGFIGMAVPDFLIALVLLVLIFKFVGVAVAGLFSPEYIDAAWSLGKVWDLMKHLVIPGIVLGTAGTAGGIRILRANLLDEIRKPYVLTARTRGLPEMRLLLKYPLRIALNPAISSVGYVLPALIGGSVIVSVVLDLNTLGPVLLEALRGQDTQLAAFIMMLIGGLTVIGTLISDILLAWLDPRIRKGFAGSG